MLEVARGYHPNVRHSSQAFKETLGITLWNVPRSQLKISHMADPAKRVYLLNKELASETQLSPTRVTGRKEVPSRGDQAVGSPTTQETALFVPGRRVSIILVQVLSFMVLGWNPGPAHVRQVPYR